MRPGPEIIRKCSSCTMPMAQATIRSGNTFGATLWTDGKMEAPMLPDLPWFVKCPHCHSLLWIDEQVELGETELGCMLISEKEKLSTKRHSKKTVLGDIEPGIPQCIAPSAEELFAFLDTNISDVKKERYLRIRAWWAGNDVRRKSRKKHHLSEKEAKNIQALVALLIESDKNDRIMKAEIMRELGRFDDAISILAMLPDKESIEAVTIIKKLALKKDPFVSKIPSEDELRKDHSLSLT